MGVGNLEAKADRPVAGRHAARAAATARAVWNRASPALFWRVFLVNATLVTLAVFLLALTPLTISDPATLPQLLLLGVALALWLLANALLLHVSLRPLRGLTGLMDRIDLLQPGERLVVSGAQDVKVVLSAFNAMLERLERERRGSSRRFVGREEAERQQLASELHDQIGQGLTALLLQLKAALAEAPESLRQPLVEAQAIARENLDEVRRIARRLRPTVLDDLGLGYALLSLADAADGQADVVIVHCIDSDAPTVAEAAELAIYRVAQEALTNALRHADASRIELAYERASRNGLVQLVVRDNGRGMIYAADVEGGGIRGMRERALAANGELLITTRLGVGTNVTLTVPAET